MRRSARLRLVPAAAALSLVVLAGSARALPLIGDQTLVLLTAKPALDAAGIVVGAVPGSLLGQDLAGRTEALFPITGGDLSLQGGTIEHGGGLLLSDGTHTLGLRNFVIDLVSARLFADVARNGSPLGTVALFDVGDCSSLVGRCFDGDGSLLLDGYRLGLTEAGAAALADAFGTSFAAGAQVGVARLDVRLVPEPSTALLLALGVAGAAGVGRRRRAAARRAAA
jgi:hypothetical protein